MNKPTRPTDEMIPAVTTGPILGSRKIYSAPDAHPDVAVPFREIALADPNEKIGRAHV